MEDTKRGHYRICVNCVMDTSDQNIRFDNKGLCNHCNEFFQTNKNNTFHQDEFTHELAIILEKIKAEGAGQQYDCILGVSGGIDSSYALIKAVEFGLRPLAVHLDSGWDSEVAVNNINNILSLLGVDLYTHVVNWEEMKDLQLAFFKASIANCDTPQDHAIISLLYKVASEHKIKYIVYGGNQATESVLPKNSWGYSARDLRHIKDIHRKFGKLKLSTYPTTSLFQEFNYRFIKQLKYFRILNYIDYNKEIAKNILMEKFGWRDYGGKHHESVLTRFFQAHYLPVKFGYDKRRAHFSSMILSGQMSRDQAIDLMTQNPVPPKLLLEDKLYVAKKLGLTLTEFDDILAQPNTMFTDFANNYLFIKTYITLNKFRKQIMQLLPFNKKIK